LAVADLSQPRIFLRIGRAVCCFGGRLGKPFGSGRGCGKMGATTGYESRTCTSSNTHDGRHLFFRALFGVLVGVGIDRSTAAPARTGRTVLSARFWPDSHVTGRDRGFLIASVEIVKRVLRLRVARTSRLWRPRRKPAHGSDRGWQADPCPSVPRRQTAPPTGCASRRKRRHDDRAARPSKPLDADFGLILQRGLLWRSRAAAWCPSQGLLRRSFLAGRSNLLAGRSNLFGEAQQSFWRGAAIFGEGAAIFLARAQQAAPQQNIKAVRNAMQNGKKDHAIDWGFAQRRCASSSPVRWKRNRSGVQRSFGVVSPAMPSAQRSVSSWRLHGRLSGGGRRPAPLRNGALWQRWNRNAAALDTNGVSPAARQPLLCCAGRAFAHRKSRMLLRAVAWPLVTTLSKNPSAPPPLSHLRNRPTNSRALPKTGRLNHPLARAQRHEDAR